MHFLKAEGGLRPGTQAVQASKPASSSHGATPARTARQPQGLHRVNCSDGDVRHRLPLTCMSAMLLLRVHLMLPAGYCVLVFWLRPAVLAAACCAGQPWLLPLPNSASSRKPLLPLPACLA